MTQQTDIRWIQRYANFHKACRRLLDVTEADRFIEDLSELELEGLVKRFGYTFELAWKVMQDLLVYKGYEFMQGPNGTMKMAFEDGLISNHDGWRKMAKSRNTLRHVYDEAEVIPIVRLIYSDYAPLLKQLDNNWTICQKIKIINNNEVRTQRHGNKRAARCLPASCQHQASAHLRLQVEGQLS